MNDIRTENMKCQVCGKTLKENPDIKEHEQECSTCGVVWGSKPRVVWDYWIKYNKNKIEIKES